jgi:hypothetical protein
MPDGRFVVTFYPISDEIIEFDSSGRFSRIVAPTGEGPGEVTGVGAMHLIRGDSLRVYDRGRMQTYAPGGGFAYSEALPIPAVSDAEPLGPGRAVVNTGTFIPRGGADPLRLVENGQVTSAFGEESDLPVTPTTPQLMVRSITSDAGGRVWSAGLTRYQIREWTAQGDPVRTWTRAVPWFEPWTLLAPVSPEAPPSARLVGIQWIGGDRLLVLSAAPGEDWKSHLGPPASGRDGRTSYPQADFTRIFQSRIEILDLERGEVLAASTDLPGAILLIDASHLAAYREDEDGNPFVDIWQFEFVAG